MYSIATFATAGTGIQTLLINKYLGQHVHAVVVLECVCHVHFCDACSEVVFQILEVGDSRDRGIHVNDFVGVL